MSGIDLLERERAPAAMAAMLRLRSARIGIATALLAAGGGMAAPALAQTMNDPELPEGFDEASDAPIGGTGDRIIEFAADRLNYDQDNDIVEAEGTVILERDEYRLIADKVRWNRTTGEVFAAGQVKIITQNGDIAYGDDVEIDESLRDGIVQNMLIVMEDGSRVAANRGVSEDGYVTLENAAYTACSVETSGGCPKTPTWRVRADRVYYDPERQRISYDNARIELFGLPVVPLPGLTHNVGSEPESGILAPKIGYSGNNGAELSVPYYLRLAPNADLTLTPYIYSNVAPMARGRYRQLLEKGAFEVEAYGTYGRRIDISGASSDPSERDLRAYVEGSGAYQFDPYWSAEASIRLATDRTFADRYDINEDDRLRNTVAVQHVSPNTFFEVRSWYVQTLRVNDPQDETPFALPMIDFRYRLPDKLMGGQLSLQANSLAISRLEGQDTQRAFASAQWDRRTILPGGQRLTFTLFGRGDVYHSDETEQTAETLYRGVEGWQTRAIATGALDLEWPLVGQALGGTQMFTPRVQLVASPEVDNLDIPNEDSRAIDLEDSNLFALNRFAGYDRYEDNVRMTYGFDWRLVRSDFTIDANIGQSYSLSNADTDVPSGTGLSERFSDFVGRVEVRWLDQFALASRFRLDKENGALRRFEADATVGSRQTYGKLGYLRLNRDISGLEDLPDREELRVAGRWQFSRNWAAYGTVIFDLTNKAEDPLSDADGFEPVKSRAGLLYEDECLSAGFIWRRDYASRGDSSADDKFSFQLSFRNLGG